VITITEKIVRRKTKSPIWQGSYYISVTDKPSTSCHMDHVKVKTVYFLFIPVFRSVQLVKSGL